MNTRTMNTPSTGPRPVGPSIGPPVGPRPTDHSCEEDALVALFAEAGLTVEIVASCGDVWCPECGSERGVGGRGDRLAA